MNEFEFKLEPGKKLNKQETYIEKDTGLFVKSTDSQTLTEKEYKFDNVDDTIFIEPDISEYTLKEKE